MRFNRIGLYSVILAIIIAISIGVPLYIKHKRTLYPIIFINTYQLNPKIGEAWELNVTTLHVPSYCWELKTPKIEIYEKEFSVNILISVRYNPRRICFVGDATYDVQIILVFPSVGNWTVRCNNELLTIYVN